MAKTQTASTLVASGAKAAATVARGRFDVSAMDGGFITAAITNGATAPTAQCAMKVLVAHKQASMPAAGSEGPGATDWKLVRQVGGGTAASASTPLYWAFGPEVAYVEVEFTAHTGSDVTVEAYGTGYTYP